ncbi:lipopolysaccharide biosynthesis protein [Dactylosporangium sp. CS-047395]|uniref:lipopolysaccharide biosynthesis protein n=1 Tax=Dactylosporangium sp. CS-047395 TaxID=3239936 RepID=UPI003D937383
MTAETQELERAAARGALATVGGQIARAVLQAGGVVLLARLVAPADYGLLAMAGVVVGTAEVVRDLGLFHAAVQAPELSRKQRDALFWCNAALGGLLYAVVWASAPSIAAAFGKDQLATVLRALALVVLVGGCTVQLRVEATRALRFGLLARIELGAVAGSLGLSALLAWRGAGVWALVAQQLFFALAVALALARAAGFRPRLSRAGVAEARPLLRFGVPVMLSSLLGSVARNADSVVVGRWFGAPALGAYDRAYQILLLPLNQLNQPLARVALPVLSRLRGSALPAFALRGQAALGFAAGTLFTCGAVAAPALFTTVLGPQWAPSAPLFRWLAVGGVFQTVSYVCDWLLLATGNARANLRLCFVTRPLLVVCMVVGAVGGPLGVAAGFAAGAALSWPIGLLWLRRATGLPVGALFAQGSRALVALAVAGLAAAVTAGPLGHGWWALSATGVLVPAYLALLATIWPAVRRDLRSVIPPAGRGPGGRRR